MEKQAIEGYAFIQHSDEINSDYYGKVVKEGNYGIILDGVKSEEIDWIKNIYEHVYNSDSFNTIAEPIEIEIHF